MKTMRYLIVILSMLVSIEAATKYVRPSAGGTASGDDWTNAYTDIPATLTRGNTYYLADGAYAPYVFDDAVSGTTVITVQKATVGAHGTSTGWLDIYGNGQATFEAVAFATSYWVFDGSAGGGPGSWKSGYGIKLGPSVGNVEMWIEGNANNITVKHVEAVGGGPDGGPHFPTTDIVLIGETGKTNANLTFSYCYFYNSGRTIMTANTGATTSVVIEYLYTGTFESVAAEHAEIFSIYGGKSDWTVRWSIFPWSDATENTGGLMFGGDDVKIYGCIFAKIPADGNEWGAGNGAIGSFTGTDPSSTLTHLKLYHCDFIGLDCRILGIFEANDTGEFKNNVFYSNSVAWETPAGITGSYNSYGAISSPPTGQTGYQNLSIDPFIDWQHLDFRPLTGTTFSAGANLPPPYSTDMFGHTIQTRGAIQATSAIQAASEPITIHGRVEITGTIKIFQQ